MEILPPRMKHGQKTNSRAQTFGIGRNAEQRFRYRAEQNAVDLARILQCQATDLLWQRKYNVEILDRQQLLLAAGEPAGTLGVLTLRAMPVAAGVVADAEMRALAALLDMAAEGGGAADLDGAHDAQLLTRQPMRGAIGGAVLSKNVSQFENWPGHGGLLLAVAPGRGCQPV